jgi:hypothetical protein
MTRDGKTLIVLGLLLRNPAALYPLFLLVRLTGRTAFAMPAATSVLLGSDTQTQ